LLLLFLRFICLLGNLLDLLGTPTYFFPFKIKQALFSIVLASPPLCVTNHLPFFLRNPSYRGPNLFFLGTAPSYHLFYLLFSCIRFCCAHHHHNKKIRLHPSAFIFIIFILFPCCSHIAFFPPLRYMFFLCAKCKSSGITMQCTIMKTNTFLLRSFGVVAIMLPAKLGFPFARKKPSINKIW